MSLTVLTFTVVLIKSTWWILLPALILTVLLIRDIKKKGH